MTCAVLAVVALTNAWGAISVDPVGATLVSYVPAGGREVLFQSSRKAVSGPAGTPFNGRAPICFPWVYDDEGRREGLHGSVYSATWRMVSRTSDALRFAVESEGYAVECEYRLGAALEVSFSARNTTYRDTPRRFCFAFHPFFLVSDIGSVSLEGLSERPMAGFGHMKGVVEATCASIVDAGWRRRIEVRSPMTRRMMYWNGGEVPRPEFAPGEWRRYLCLEPANNVAADAVTVEPGERADIVFAIAVSPL